MPGPLGVIAPTTDPNWAWDTIGWNNQTNTGDVQTSASATTPGFLGDPGASGMLARTMDSDDLAAAGVVAANNVGYFGLCWVPEDISTKQACWAVVTSGTTAHGYVTLMSVAGVVVLQTADMLSTFGTTGTADAAYWAGASSTVSLTVAAGYYYLGVGSATGQTWGGGLATTVAVNKLNPSAYSATPPYARWITGVPNTVTYTAVAPASFGTLTISPGTSLGGIFVGMF